jgi:hypothetical protein
MVDKHYALSREAILAALTSYSGVTTADGATPGNNTLIDSNLIGKNDFLSGKVILIGSGVDAAYEDKGVESFDNVTGEITVSAGFSAQIKQDTPYRVLNVSSGGVVSVLLTDIKAQTDLIPATPADEATSLLIKAKTDTLPASPADEATVNAVGVVATAIKAATDKIASFQHEIEWSSTPVSEQVASAAATNLTAGSITPTFPTGATPVRALLVASIHAANQAANAHHISLKVQGQKASGGYTDKIDLTAQTTLGLVNLDGASDSWVGSVDVTSLVDASAAQYDFRFVVDSDNAGAVNYTTVFLLVLVYRI